MARYNLDALSFLIGSFKDTVNTIGQNRKTLEFFTRQTQGLMNIGQIRYDEVSIIEQLIEPLISTNDTSVQNQRWSLVLERVDMFTNAVNNIMAYNNEAMWAMVLNEMKHSKEIDATVLKLVCEVFEIDQALISQKKANKNTGAFGQIPTAGKVNTGIHPVNQHVIMVLENIQRKYNNVYLRVANPDRACSGDPIYFTTLLESVIKVLKDNKKTANTAYNARSALKYLKAGQRNYAIVSRSKDTDPCGHSINYDIITDATIMCQNLIDWTAIELD